MRIVDIEARATEPSDKTSLSWGARSLHHSFGGQAQQSPHQKLKETEHIGGWEEGQASSLQNGPPEIPEPHGRWSGNTMGEKEAKGQAPGCPLPSRKDPHPGQPPFSLIY